MLVILCNREDDGLKILPKRVSFEKHGDYVLRFREPGWDEENDLLVIGDGVSPVKDLPRIPLPKRA